MLSVKGITVCVDYDDLLAITLPRNSRFLSEIVVVTTREDIRTQEVVAKVPNARCFFTEAFYRNGAYFNKGLSIEEGLDELERDGWILIWDADTLLSDRMSWEGIDKGFLYGTGRRILEDPTQWREDLDWSGLPLTNIRGSIPGFFQLFNGDDPVLIERPWYATDFNHAGGCDGYFQEKWEGSRKKRLPEPVLHISQRDKNWFGRVTRRVDGLEVEGSESHRELMNQFLDSKGWNEERRLKGSFQEKIESDKR